MTHAVYSLPAEPGPVAREQLPYLPPWVAPRPRLDDRLELGTSGLVTLVTGPAGSGKTLGVASWAARTQLPESPVWVNASGTGAEPDLLWRLLHEGLVEGGGRHLAPVPSGLLGSRRDHALALLGTSLRQRGPRLVVLDNFPTGRPGALGRDLEIVLDHAQRALALVVISRGEPALPVQRQHVAGDLTRISVPDLAMDWHEVADVLVATRRRRARAHGTGRRAAHGRMGLWGAPGRACAAGGTDHRRGTRRGRPGDGRLPGRRGAGQEPVPHPGADRPDEHRGRGDTGPREGGPRSAGRRRAGR